MIKMFGKQVNHEFGINRKGFLNNLPTPPQKKISSGNRSVPLFWQLEQEL